MQKATIKDVAKLAKVSPSTVSRVLSGNPSISERYLQTRKKRRKRNCITHPTQLQEVCVVKKAKV